MSSFFSLASPILVLLVLLLAQLSSTSAQQWEFCYLIIGQSHSYGVANHGYFYTNSSTVGSDGRTVYNIYNSVSTRTVISILGQTHVESLTGIVTANNRVDDNLFLQGAKVDGSGIQLPITGSFANATAGIGTVLGYDNAAQPLTIVTNPALSVAGQQLTSQLNSNINVLWTGSQYGERLDAGGATTTGATSAFYVQPYTTPNAITNCTLQLYSPQCTNYPQTPPTGSVIYNVTLNTPWAQLNTTYVTDLVTALTQLLAVGTPFASQANYLGLFLFSCYPLFTKAALPQPLLSFYLNAQSVSQMGLSLTAAQATVYSALQPSSTALNAYLPAYERGRIAAQGCPFVFNGAALTQLCGTSPSPSTATPAPSTASPTANPTPSTGGGVSPPLPATSAPVANTGGGGGGSSLSGGAIAGIVVGSVVGAALILLILLCAARTLCVGGGSEKSASAGKASRFEDESSRNQSGVEMN